MRWAGFGCPEFSIIVGMCEILNVAATLIAAERARCLSHKTIGKLRIFSLTTRHDLIENSYVLALKCQDKPRS
jgi:hypothetical protein